MKRQGERRYRSFIGPVSVIGALWLMPVSQAKADPSATDRAAAEALFQQGTALMAEKQYARACEKFDGSNQLDPALGTLLRLGDCYDRIGKTASAWAVFRESASLARTRNELDRYKIASDRATDLEKRLSKVELKIDSKNASSGLEIRLNGTLVPRASWDAPIPVDPGRLQIEASAPDRLPWSAAVDVNDGPAQKSVDVPALGLKASTAPATGVATQENAPGRGNLQRTLGFVAGGIGLAGLAASGYLTWRASDSNKQSLDHCRPEDPNACDQQGVDHRADAQRFATFATVAVAVSVPVLAGGVILLLTAPRTETPRPTGHALQPIFDVSSRGGSVGVKGTW